MHRSDAIQHLISLFSAFWLAVVKHRWDAKGLSILDAEEPWLKLVCMLICKHQATQKSRKKSWCYMAFADSCPGSDHSHTLLSVWPRSLSSISQRTWGSHACICTLDDPRIVILANPLFREKFVALGNWKSFNIDEVGHGPSNTMDTGEQNEPSISSSWSGGLC